MEGESVRLIHLSKEQAMKRATPNPIPPSSSRPSSSPSSHTQQYTEALHLLQVGQHEEGLKCITSILETKKSLGGGEYLEALQNAIACIKEVLVLSPNNSSLFFHAHLISELAAHYTGSSFEPVFQVCYESLNDVERNNFESPTKKQYTEKLRSLIRECNEFNLNKLLDEPDSISQPDPDLQSLVDGCTQMAQIASEARLDFMRPDEEKEKFKKEVFQKYEKNYQQKELSINIKEVESYFHTNELAKALLREAVEYWKEEETWVFWDCFCCGKKFQDFNSHINTHVGSIVSKESKAVLPERVDDSVSRAVESGLWSAVDTSAAKKAMMMDYLGPQSKAFLPSKWPRCDIDEDDDAKDRSLIMQDIRLEIVCLLESKCFDKNLLNNLLKLIMSRIEKHIPETLLHEYKIDKELESVCFLNETDLHDVLDFLDDINQSCKLDCLSKMVVMGQDRDEFLDKIRISEAEFVLNELLGEIYVIVIGERLNHWKTLRETINSQATKLFELLRIELHLQQEMCNRKIEFRRYLKLLTNSETLSNEEDQRREGNPGSDPQSNKSVSVQEKMKLDTTKVDMMQWILTKAEGDIHEKELIHKLVAHLYKMENRLNVIILALDTIVAQTRKKIEKTTAFDFQVILVDLLKSFMQASLEGLAERDSVEKSNAAVEVLSSQHARPGQAIGSGEELQENE